MGLTVHTFPLRGDTLLACLVTLWVVVVVTSDAHGTSGENCLLVGSSSTGVAAALRSPRSRGPRGPQTLQTLPWDLCLLGGSRLGQSGAATGEPATQSSRLEIPVPEALQGWAQLSK